MRVASIRWLERVGIKTGERIAIRTMCEIQNQGDIQKGQETWCNKISDAVDAPTLTWKMGSATPSATFPKCSPIDTNHQHFISLRISCLDHTNLIMYIM